MRQPAIVEKKPDAMDAVSEIIGAVLMVSLVALAATIIAMLLFSQTSPQEIPNINFMTGSDNNDRLFLYHNGGDSLVQGSFSIVVDDTIRNDYTISDGGDEWSLGKNLILTGVPAGSHTVAIVYNGTGTGSVILRSASASALQSPGAYNPDYRPRSTYPSVISIPHLMQNLTNNSVNYYRAGGTRLSGGYLKFNVTSPNSSMFYQPDASSSPVLVQLDVGNVVHITPYVVTIPDPFSQNIRVFGIGDQIWEIAADNATLVITNRSAGDFNPGRVPITHTWVTGYKDFESTLTIAPGSPAGAHYTQLVLNHYPSYDASQTFSSQIINATSTSVATIQNAGPTQTGLFVLQYDNRTRSTYFVGNGLVSW
jgi:hypothetical protein